MKTLAEIQVCYHPKSSGKPLIKLQIVSKMFTKHSLYLQEYEVFIYPGNGLFIIL